MNKWNGIVAGALVSAIAGCAGRGPVFAPAVPDEIETRADGTTEHGYDCDGDGRVDYIERLGASGRVDRIRIDTDGDGTFDVDTPWPAPVDDPSVRHLMLLLDSIPYTMVQDAWDHGRMRLFAEPARLISPFPVMTDLSFSEFFGVSPMPGVESSFYDGTRLRSGYGEYAGAENAGWLAMCDYKMHNLAHFAAYNLPDRWYNHELRKIQDLFAGSADRLFIGYCMGPSALGGRRGRDGHQAGLVRIDRYCREEIRRAKGRLHITMLSDHGHNLVPSKIIDLRFLLTRCGYRVSNTLAEPTDVVIPEFGLVTCAALHTQRPAQVAADVVGGDGIVQTAYREGDDVVVLGRSSRARISRRGDRLRYSAQRGDPLELLPIWATLKKDADGFVDDRELLAATAEHTYPDAVARLWRAFHGLVENTPDVLATIEDGRHAGSRFLSSFIDFQAAHGNLGRLSSYGFVITTAGELPAVSRMADLNAELRKLGLPMRYGKQ